MQGIDWTPESSMDEIGRSYTSAFSQHYVPFGSQHEYMLEHYLVSYVHRTLFPLGPQERNPDLSVHHIRDSIRDQCLLLVVHYAIIQTILIGVARFHKTEFDAGHAIKVIQSFAKAFEHSLSFPDRALQILADKGMKTCTSLAMLVRN
jgi:lysine-N-methylase